MKNEINTSIGKFIISASSGRSTISPFDKKSRVFKYVVQVQFNGNAETFDFFGSINDRNNGKREMDKADLGFALYCLFSDAIAGTYNLDTFQSEFGYEKASECLRAWQACQKQLEKVKNLGISESDLYDISNELSEKYG